MPACPTSVRTTISTSAAADVPARHEHRQRIAQEPARRFRRDRVLRCPGTPTESASRPVYFRRRFGMALVPRAQRVAPALHRALVQVEDADVAPAAAAVLQFGLRRWLRLRVGRGARLHRGHDCRARCIDQGSRNPWQAGLEPVSQGTGDSTRPSSKNACRFASTRSPIACRVSRVELAMCGSSTTLSSVMSSAGTFGSFS